MRFSFVVLAAYGELLLSVSGPLGGVSQTVPRAELTALITILEHTSGYLPVVTDSKYVFNGISRGPKRGHSSNWDFRAKLWKTYRTRIGISKLD